MARLRHGLAQRLRVIDLRVFVQIRSAPSALSGVPLPQLEALFQSRPQARDLAFQEQEHHLAGQRGKALASVVDVDPLRAQRLTPFA